MMEKGPPEIEDTFIYTFTFSIIRYLGGWVEVREGYAKR